MSISIIGFHFDRFQFTTAFPPARPVLLVSIYLHCNGNVELMIARLAFALWIAVSIVAVIISTTVLSSGAMWNAFVLAAYRKISLFVPPKYAFGGDSLTEQCGWRWRIAKNPLSVVNLAAGGAVIRQMSKYLRLESVVPK